jgi:hypothetical protein
LGERGRGLLPTLGLHLACCGVRFRRHHDDRRRIVSAVGGSVGFVLCVGFAVLGGARFLVRPGVSHDAGRSVLVAVRCVLDECLLGEFEPLGLASSGLVHGTALLAFTLGAIDDGFVRGVVIHGPNCTASAQAPDSETWGGAFPYLSGDPAEGKCLARRSRKLRDGGRFRSGARSERLLVRWPLISRPAGGP